MRSTIICVDDDKLILTTLSEQLISWLGANYTIEKAMSGQEALDIIADCQSEGTDVSLVVSDYLMPGMKGDEVLEQVKNMTPMTRRIMLTGFSALEGVANAINKAGIYRYLSKPWDAKDMMLTVLQAIRSYEQDKRTDQLNERNKVLCGTLEKLAHSLQIKLHQTTNSLATAIELREGSVSGHSKRVEQYAVQLAEALNLQSESVKNLKIAALLHDVGKLGLSDKELESVKNIKRYDDKSTAALLAERAKSILGDMDKSTLLGVMYHAERMDGKGAFGIDGTDIPLEAKIIGLCDYYDTLHTAYANAAQNEILTAMEAYKGKIFDAELFDKFAALELK